MSRVTSTITALYAAVWIGAAATPPRPVATGRPAAPQVDSIERAKVLHLLNRLAYGPRPGDVDRVLAMGIDRFIDQQLHPDRIADQGLTQRLRRFEILETSPRELARVFAEAQRDRRERQREMATDSALLAGRMSDDPGRRARMFQDAMRNPVRRLLGEYQEVTVVRAALSERQLYEVLVDFWANHFNVFIGKGADRFLLPSYIEETIRPNALGKFEDLLIATAKSPAMLFYLDNAQSVAPGSRPPQLARLEAARARPRPFFGPRAGMTAERMDSIRSQIEARLPKGINENYARELMELHTLGVDGGYTQQDVGNVARILTGWSIALPRRDPGFVFNDWAHDRGEKVVLGRRFPAGHGMDEGIELLRLLARHPATMRHVSAKLCARFVSDSPPDGCIDAGVHAWQKSDGQIRAVVHAIVTSPEFWAPENRGAKIKTPLEFVVSAIRALGAEPDSTLMSAQVVARLGQPLYGQQPPTGYPETQDAWVNTGALLQRMNVAMGLASGRLPGVKIDLDNVAPAAAPSDSLIAAVNRNILNGAASPHTIRTMKNQTRDLSGEMARAMVVGLALGSPEFQKQ
ncbi:MAG: DUF1800 domain-containing protein [Gemmatimonadetes bacterium]|nr:DUF1800 domain-containing protein [Gemmatimonadota bacterium]